MQGAVLVRVRQPNTSLCDTPLELIAPGHLAGFAERTVSFRGMNLEMLVKEQLVNRYFGKSLGRSRLQKLCGWPIRPLSSSVGIIEVSDLNMPEHCRYEWSDLGSKNYVCDPICLRYKIRHRISYSLTPDMR